METARTLPPEIQELVDAGTLRHSGDVEFVIDALKHRTRRGCGWETSFYLLRIEEDDDGNPHYDIVKESRDYGDDVVDSFDDPDDAACWITNSIKEIEEMER